MGFYDSLTKLIRDTIKAYVKDVSFFYKARVSSKPNGKVYTLDDGSTATILNNGEYAVGDEVLVIKTLDGNKFIYYWNSGAPVLQEALGDLVAYLSGSSIMFYKFSSVLGGMRHSGSVAGLDSVTFLQNATGKSFGNFYGYTSMTATQPTSYGVSCDMGRKYVIAVPSAGKQVVYPVITESATVVSATSPAYSSDTYRAFGIIGGGQERCAVLTYGSRFSNWPLTATDYDLYDARGRNMISGVSTTGTFPELTRSDLKLVGYWDDSSATTMAFSYNTNSVTVFNRQFLLASATRVQFAMEDNSYDSNFEFSGASMISPSYLRRNFTNPVTAGSLVTAGTVQRNSVLSDASGAASLTFLSFGESGLNSYARLTGAESAEFSIPVSQTKFYPVTGTGNGYKWLLVNCPGSWLYNYVTSSCTTLTAAEVGETGAHVYAFMGPDFAPDGLLGKNGIIVQPITKNNTVDTLVSAGALWMSMAVKSAPSISDVNNISFYGSYFRIQNTGEMEVGSNLNTPVEFVIPTGTIGQQGRVSMDELDPDMDDFVGWDPLGATNFGAWVPHKSTQIVRMYAVTSDLSQRSMSSVTFPGVGLAFSDIIGGDFFAYDAAATAGNLADTTSIDYPGGTKLRVNFTPTPSGAGVLCSWLMSCYTAGYSNVGVTGVFSAPSFTSSSGSLQVETNNGSNTSFVLSPSLSRFTNFTTGDSIAVRLYNAGSARINWQISSNPTWATVVPSSGSCADASVYLPAFSEFSISASANTGSNRTGTISILGNGESKTVQVFQPGVANISGVYYASPDIHRLAQTAVSYTSFSAYTPSGANVSSGSPWCSVTPLVLPSGLAWFTVSATSNASNVDRTAEITVAASGLSSVKCFVTQTGGASFPTISFLQQVCHKYAPRDVVLTLGAQLTLPGPGMLVAQDYPGIVELDGLGPRNAASTNPFIIDDSNRLYHVQADGYPNPSLLIYAYTGQLNQSFCNGVKTIVGPSSVIATNSGLTYGISGVVPSGTTISYDVRSVDTYWLE